MNNQIAETLPGEHTPATLFASRVVESDRPLSAGTAFPAEIDTDEARLSISGSSPSFANPMPTLLDSREATLRVGKLRAPLSVTVELNVWSATATEVAVRPPNRLPFLLTEDRYLSSVDAVLDALVKELTDQGTAAASAWAGLRRPA